MSRRPAFGPALLAVLLGLSAAACSAQTLINSSFEDPRQSPGTADFDLVGQSLVPGWSTTASDGLIEFWSDGFIFPSYDLDQHVELNANEVSALFQDLAGVPGGRTLSFSFAHRGRQGVDTIELTITDLGGDDAPGGGDDTILFDQQYATDNVDWAVYTSATEAPIVSLGNTLRVAFTAVSAAGGNPAVGNLLDDVRFGLGIVPSPAVEVPTLGVWSGMLLALILAALSLVVLRRL